MFGAWALLRLTVRQHDRAFYSRVRGEEIPEGHTEWPEEWWSDLDGQPLMLLVHAQALLITSLRPQVSKLLTSQEYDPRVNKYGVKASQSIEEWEKAGWVQGQDPRGWMQVRSVLSCPSAYDLVHSSS